MPLKVSVEQAVDAARRGDHHYALWAMRILSEADPANLEYFRNHASAAVRLDAMRAVADPRLLSHPYRPCPLLGQAGDELLPVQRRIIEGILNAHWDEWTAKPTLPARVDVFDAGKGFRLPDVPVKVAIVFQKHLHGAPDHMESDFYVHLCRSARRADLDTEGFDAGALHYEPATNPQKYPPNRPFADLVGDLTTFLERFKPDIVVTDGNYEPLGNSLDAAYWLEAKAKIGFKLAVVIPDCYDAIQPFSESWDECADLLIAFHAEAKQLIGKRKAVIFPVMPFDESFFEKDVLKDIEVSLVGSNTRKRREWVEPLQVAGVQAIIRLHDRTKDSAPNFDEYYRVLLRSKIIFNNGYISSHLNINTARFFEGVLARTLVLQQSGAPVDQFFVPFIHFVPVTNIDQMISFARFFLENEAWRQRIVDAARAFWDAHYSTGSSWRFICRQLLDSAPSV